MDPGQEFVPIRASGAQTAPASPVSPASTRAARVDRYHLSLFVRLDFVGALPV
jgi:hypothetical protein